MGLPIDNKLIMENTAWNFLRLSPFRDTVLEDVNYQYSKLFLLIKLVTHSCFYIKTC